MKFYIVDAFTNMIFGGNPAGVVIIPQEDSFPSKEQMKKTAAELRYSETAFIKQISNQNFQIQYYTPTEEVDLCGHATIATFQALLNDHVVRDNSSYYIETKAGTLSIEIDRRCIWMEMAPPKSICRINDTEALIELYHIMGLDYETSKTNLYPELISTGLPDIIMPVASEKDLEDINPNYQALCDLSKKYQAVGVHAFVIKNHSYESNDITMNSNSPFITQCRNFAPLYGINEEAATGTSNGALTYFLYKNGILKEGMHSTFIQGEAMNRPSQIHTRIRNEIVERTPSTSDIRIQVGGSGIVLAHGEINI